TDAAGMPLDGISVGVNLPAQFLSYMTEPRISFPVEYGTLELPVPVTPLPKYHRPRVPVPHMMVAPMAYKLYLTDKVSNQTYEVSVPETEHTEPVTVMLPVVRGDAPEGVDVVEGEIAGPEGARTGAVGFSFGSWTP